MIIDNNKLIIINNNLITYPRIGECFPAEAEKWEIRHDDDDDDDDDDDNSSEIFGNRCLQYESTLDQMMFVILDTKALLWQQDIYYK